VFTWLRGAMSSIRKLSNKTVRYKIQTDLRGFMNI
jgi:hypothetical protein